MHLAAGAHIGVMVIPAALALAQRDHWSGEQLLKAIVGGYEMAAVLGSAVRHSGLCNPHFRPSGIIGSFAAAATGIVADPTMTRAHAAHALGLAANMSAGLNEWPWAGGLEIQTHMGTATRAGVTSYDLARAGMSSSETVLEGKDGLFVAYGCGDRDVAATAFRSWLVEAASNEALGFGTGIMGTKFKPVAGCNFIQTPVSVALQIHTNLQPNITATTENIEWVTIVTTSPARAYPGCDNGGPFQKEQQTKMSLQYGVSAALLFGRVDEGMYVQFSNAGLQKLIQECVLETDPMYDEKLFKRGKQPCRIEVRMKDGHIHRASMDDVPWLEGQAVEERFRREAAAVFDPAVATTSDIVDQIVLECQRLEGASSTDRLCDLLASAAVEGPLDER
jgi:2-methylcitrate dehydratase PrpD